MPTKRIVIVGSYKAHRALIPWDDPAYEIWGMNRFWQWMRTEGGRLRAQRWFEMHPLDVQEEQDLEFMRTCPVPLYVLKADPQFPTAVEYPLDEVSKLVGRQYFTSTFAYQLALAIYERAESVHCYGLGFCGGRERLVEKPCFEFWCGVAAACGIPVEIMPVPGTLPIAQSRWLYGYDYWLEKKRVERECMAAIPHVVHDAFYGSH